MSRSARSTGSCARRCRSSCGTCCANSDITSIFVTHDQDEALVMSDRIAVMNEGRIEHLASPSEVYSRPKTLYVMEFVGQSTRIAGRVAAADRGAVSVETPYGRISGRGKLRGRHARRGRCPAGSHPARRRARTRSSTTFAPSCSTSSISDQRPICCSQAAAPGDRILVELARLPQTLAPGADVALRWRIEDTMVFPAP